MLENTIVKVPTELPQLKEYINERKATLQRVAISLKEYFIGLDTIIDEVIKNIEAWYVMPDLLKRPVIINLWGLTGVGKTDLVRRLAKELAFNDKFVEIQLVSSKGNSKRYSALTVQEYLNCSDLNPGEPGILLLDEIQNFRSIDKDNNDNDNESFQDIWTLLSDGKFSNANAGIKERIFSIVFDNEVDYETEKKEGRGQSFSHAKYLKKFFKLEASIDDIMRWEDVKKNTVLLDRMKDQELYDGDDFSKLLIFISGNLDEAFTIATSLADVDVDADVFHNFSKTIDVITIKKALKKRFKPEQISRLGNTHIIYPSLNGESYKKIIKKKITETLSTVKTLINVDVDVDESFETFIYRNGVFPSQGTRPLFSTIATYFEANIPTFILCAIENNVSKIVISYDSSTSDIVLADENKLVLKKLSVIGMIDKLRFQDGKNDKRNIIASVHEGAHALVYALNFNIAPIQTVSNAVDDQMFGFIRTHEIIQTKEVILKRIMVSLAGLVAEELLFGATHRTDGSDSDIEHATVLAGELIRKHGMENTISRINSPFYSDTENEFPTYLNNDITSSNSLIENILKEQKDATKKMIEENLELYKSIVDALLKTGRVSTDELKTIFARYNIDINVIDNDEPVFYGEFIEAFEKLNQKQLV